MPELSKRQRLAAESEAFEVLFGGAVFGGKTYLLAWVAKNQGRSVLMTRKTYGELEESLIQECLDRFPDGSNHYAGSPKYVFTYPDQRIKAGYAARFEDALNYKSAQYDTLLCDEITQWPDPRIYEYLISRVRTRHQHQRCRVICCSNPGEDGEPWVLHRWRAWLDPNYHDKAEPGELRWFRRDEKGNDVECNLDHPDALSRTFIPSFMADNPCYTDAYRRQIDALPEPLRTQLRDGVWGIGVEDNPWQLIPTAWIDASMDRWKKPTGKMDALGVDVARGGKDQTVLTPRYGRVVDELQPTSGKLTIDGPAVAALVVNACPPDTLIGLDIIGVGTSPYDILTSQGYNVIPLNGSAKAMRIEYGVDKPYTDRSGQLSMRNLRAGIFWNLRELLEDGDIDLPPDPELRADLIALRWKITPAGVQVEDKDDIKKRIGRSPDKGDAVGYACWVQPSTPIQPASSIAMG